MSDDSPSTTSACSHSIVIFALCATVSFRLALIECDPDSDRICLAGNIESANRSMMRGVWCRTNLVDQIILEGCFECGGKMQPIAASTSIPFAVAKSDVTDFLPAPAWSAWISWTKSHSPLFDVLPKSFKFASLCASQEKNLLFFHLF